MSGCVWSLGNSLVRGVPAEQADGVSVGVPLTVRTSFRLLIWAVGLISCVFCVRLLDLVVLDVGEDADVFIAAGLTSWKWSRSREDSPHGPRCFLKRRMTHVVRTATSGLPDIRGDMD